MRLVCTATADLGTLQLQYETVKKAQAEEHARQQAEAGQQAKFEQPQQVGAGGCLARTYTNISCVCITALYSRL